MFCSRFYLIMYLVLGMFQYFVEYFEKMKIFFGNLVVKQCYLAKHCFDTYYMVNYLSKNFFDTKLLRLYNKKQNFYFKVLENIHQIKHFTFNLQNTQFKN